MDGSLGCCYWCFILIQIHPRWMLKLSPLSLPLTTTKSPGYIQSQIHPRYNCNSIGQSSVCSRTLCLSTVPFDCLVVCQSVFVCPSIGPSVCRFVRPYVRLARSLSCPTGWFFICYMEEGSPCSLMNSDRAFSFLQPVNHISNAQ